MEIAPVLNGRDLDRFIAFPYDHYREDPLWVPQLRRDVRTLLTPSKNPFWEHAEAQYWIAKRDGRMVGRIGAIKNDMHNTEHQDKVGFYGFFESIDDQTVANALFDTAAAWLRAKGFDTMRGPMNPSVNDECGLLIKNNGTPPSLMMPYNFSYYESLHERYGFTKAKDLLAYNGGGSGELAPERFVRLAHRAMERRGITLRTLNMKRFDEEVELIKALYNSAWEKNWGFVPLTGAEIDHLAKQLKPIVVPDLVIFAELHGKIVGFGLALPDFNLALLHNRSGRMFPGILKVLWYSRKISRARVLLLGVIPEFRGRGVDAALYERVWQHSVKRGMPSGEAGWILEDNALMNKAATQLGFRISKTYRVYDKAL